MATLPNIPSVRSTIEDTTLASQDTPQGRAPMLFHFSKYGEEEFVEYSAPEYFTYLTGSISQAKYGLGSTFIRDALTETNRVLAKRLMPSDATFANISINNLAEALTYDNIVVKDQLFKTEPFLLEMPLDDTSVAYDEYLIAKDLAEVKAFEKMNLVLGHIAKGRGAGYNDIFVMYSAAPEYEKMDSNLEGESNYKFNFIKGEIFEKVTSGYKQLGDPFVFSLMDINFETNEPIKSSLADVELFANTIVTDSNHFVDIQVNPEHLPEIRQIRNIDDLMPEGRLIVPDINNNGTADKYYEIKLLTDTSILPNAKKITPVITEKLPSIEPRVGYSKDIYPFLDDTRDDLTSIITNSTVGDYRHSDNATAFTDTTSSAFVDYGLALTITTSASDVAVVKASISKPSTSDITVVIDVVGVGPFAGSINSDPAYMDVIVIPAGSLFADLDINAYYGGKPASFEARIVTPETDAVGKYPIGTFPTDGLGNRINIRSEYDATNAVQRLRDFVTMDIVDPLNTKVSIEISDTLAGTTLTTADANYKMVHNVILEAPLTKDEEVTVEYSVVIGTFSETVELILDLPFDALDPSKTVFEFDFHDLVKSYNLSLFLYKDLYVDSGELKLSPVEVLTPVSVRDSFYIDGDEEFSKLTFNALLFLSSGVDEFLVDKYEFLRHTIYNKLVGNSIKLYNGADGDYLFDNKGLLNLTGASAEGQENAKDCLLKELTTNQEIRQVLYPRYKAEYLPTWFENIDIINAGVELCDATEMIFGLHSIPTSYDPSFTTMGQADKDVEIRKNSIYKSSSNNMLITSEVNKTHKDIFDGSKYSMPASYYMMMNHLKMDNEISLTEPVANVEKGTIRNTSVNLQYNPSAEEIATLRNNQINAIIVENDGTYFIDQLTMLKKVSKLNNVNTVKTIQQLRKDLPGKLKRFLQLKAIGSIESGAVKAAQKEVDKYVISDANLTDGLFEYANIVPYYNELTKRLRLTMTVSPVGTYEVIEIPIVVA